jgi:hypothetical protein
VLRPEIGDQRNLLNAWLCDAAVVFDGGLGTVSECVSALCLGRPVLLVGETWRDEEHQHAYVDLPALFGNDPVRVGQRDDLAAGARAKLGDEVGAMAHHVRTHVTADRLVASDLCRHVGMRGVIPTLGGWLADVTADRRGSFPGVGGFEDLERAYHDWWRSLHRT